MVFVTSFLVSALALVSSGMAAPAEDTTLVTRQNAPWQYWTEGRGQFSCQQQGGGKDSCSWNGQIGGGLVAGSGWQAGRK
jgi:endo-1,4-beta-xylanase